MSGIGAETFLERVKGQSFLEREDFVKKLITYIKGQEEIKEFPRQQRFIGRPGRETLFSKKIKSIKRKRNVKILESVEKYSYRQREVADYLVPYYSFISRLLQKNSHSLQ